MEIEEGIVRGMERGRDQQRSSVDAFLKTVDRLVDDMCIFSFRTP
jgi:hypothetical protein